MTDFLNSATIRVVSQDTERGWEISNDYRQHYMDDPNWDLSEDAEQHDGKFIAVLWVAVVLALGSFAVHHYLDHSDTVKISFDNTGASFGFNMQGRLPRGMYVPPGWVIHCVKINEKGSYMEPNYEDPACSCRDGKLAKGASDEQ